MAKAYKPIEIGKLSSIPVIDEQVNQINYSFSNSAEFAASSVTAYTVPKGYKLLLYNNWFNYFGNVAGATIAGLNVNFRINTPTGNLSIFDNSFFISGPDNVFDSISNSFIKPIIINQDQTITFYLNWNMGVNGNFSCTLGFSGLLIKNTYDINKYLF